MEADISTEEAVQLEVESTESVLAGETPRNPTEPPPGGSEASDSLGPLRQEYRRYKSHKEFGDRREGVTGARTYFYEGEPECDRNMVTHLKSIEAVSHATESKDAKAILSLYSDKSSPNQRKS